jgi:hypothetical protein
MSKEKQKISSFRLELLVFLYNINSLLFNPFSGSSAKDRSYSSETTMPTRQTVIHCRNLQDMYVNLPRPHTLKLYKGPEFVFAEHNTAW